MRLEVDLDLEVSLVVLRHEVGLVRESPSVVVFPEVDLGQVDETLALDWEDIPAGLREEGSDRQLRLYQPSVL